jgi:hypothetical protein
MLLQQVLDSNGSLSYIPFSSLPSPTNPNIVPPRVCQVVSLSYTLPRNFSIGTGQPGAIIYTGLTLGFRSDVRPPMSGCWNKLHGVLAML